MSESGSTPTRDDVARILQQLIAGEISPEAASNWASAWVNRFEELKRLDRRAKDALDSLALADTPTTDRPYLYGQADFENWLRELMA
jgi:hypothetical protein